VLTEHVQWPKRWNCCGPATSWTRAVYQGLRSDLRTSRDLISSHMGVVATSPEVAEARTALTERRPPEFRKC
jgi:hypothetical protein